MPKFGTLLIVLASPFLLYVLLKYAGARLTLLLLTLLFGRKYVLKAWPKDRHIGRLLSAQLVLLLIFVGVSLYWNHPVTVKILPAIFSFFLFGTFGFSVLKGPSMAENFARMKDAYLTEAQIRYCRQVTLIWSVFFLLNALFILIVSLTGSLEAWLMVIGPISYALIALLFFSEYIVRTIKFNKYDQRLVIDRLIKKCARK
ncbi:hypothetical protein JXQ70_19955 [bacterium]|nr:hypothetical protein [bacterium]